MMYSPRAPFRFAAAVLLGLFVSVGCGDDENNNPGSGGSGASAAGGSGAMAAGGDGQGGMTGGGGQGGMFELPECVVAEGPMASPTDTWSDTPYTAGVTVENAESCERTYTLTTDAPLRDNQPGNPRTVIEMADQPVLRTGHDMFDALYALALDEVKECSVDSIEDYAFNNGNPIPCPAGGCFETGRLWKYVWTRDTAYSVALGLGQVDPTRSRNSLEFKVSERRDGTDPQIVQDTGTGGSYPVSTDRVVWAIGAWELLKFLDGAERDAFRELAYEAIVNTVEHDRNVVWDAEDGLYRGEQSFLDWREQSYAAFTATDTVQIGMSKSLSTNVGHYVLLDVAAKLAAEKGDSAAATKYADWANLLRDSIRSRLYLDGIGQFSTFVPTHLDQAPTNRYDLLGSSLAVLYDVANASEAVSVAATYPVLPKGPAVLWPQQQDVPIYHNRGNWPFVTSFWAKAAKKAGNADAVTNAINALVRGSALNLSNMENFEAVTGANWKDEGATSGPVVNSQRQLWSVAGYVSMVQDVIFGMEASQTGIRFAPFIPWDLRDDLFAGSNRIGLSNLRYRGKKISVAINLPRTGADTGVLTAASVRLNGQDIGLGEIESADLPNEALFEIDLQTVASSGPMALVDEAAISDYRNVFGPKTPSVSSVSVQGGLVQIGIGLGGESAADVTINVYRDGEQVATGLPGSTTVWQDPNSAGHTSNSYCYTVETVYASGNASQHAAPNCYWGPGFNRIQTWNAQQFTANGGNLVFNHGEWHYEGWGAPSHEITLTNVTTDATGEHLIQVLAGNGAGGYTTGITCAVKAVEVYEGNTLVGGGQLMMPHLGTWDDWRNSSFVPVTLEAGKTYTIVIRQNAQSNNMSVFEHFSIYGGMGGQSGPFNDVNIAEIKLLRRTGQ